MGRSWRPDVQCTQFGDRHPLVTLACGLIKIGRKLVIDLHEVGIVLTCSTVDLQFKLNRGFGMMDFKKAIAVAEKNAKELVPGAKDFTLEGAIVSGANYEITLSYYLNGMSPLELSGDGDEKNSIFRLAKLMGTRREYKVFIVDKNDFAFKGFKAYKEK